MRRLWFIFLTFITTTLHAQQNRIEIIRDSYGVPHIYAPTDAEAAYGLAWAFCEDDFQAIEKMIAWSRARLSEIKGVEAAPQDFFIQFLKARILAHQQVDTVWSEGFKKILQSYVDGVNVYAQKHPEEIHLKDLFPANIEDIACMYHAILAAMVGMPDAINSIRNNKPDEYLFRPSSRNEETGTELPIGSNAFALRKKLMKDNATHLVINPHIPVEGDIYWYEAQVHSGEGWHVHGAMFPGALAQGLGANENLGWAMTFNWPDYVDIYELQVNEKKMTYTIDGIEKPLEVLKNKMKIKTGIGKIRVAKKSWFCEIGPVLKNKKGYYALRYGAKNPAKAAEEWYWMGKAQNLNEFKKALEIQAIPLFNIVYADKEDNIFYISNANLPERNSKYDWQKVLPGYVSDAIWKDYIPMDKLPQIQNPECSYIYNTNNTPFHTTSDSCALDANQFPKECAWHWNRENNRDKRFRELIESQSTYELADLKRIKFDRTYPQSGSIMRTWKSILSISSEKYPDIKEAIQFLQSWNLTGDSTNVQAPLAMISMRYAWFGLGYAYVELEEGHEVPETTMVESIRKAIKYLEKHYQTYKIPLGNVQRLMRLDKSYAVSGLPESLRAVYGTPNDQGKIRVEGGDTFTMFVQWKDGRVQAESVVPFGSSNRKTSPHYTDQMELYAKEKFKTVIFDKTELLKNGGKISYPEK